MKKKTISLALVLSLLLCSFAIISSAADSKNYVVLGDSIAYGSGLFNPKNAVYGKIVADTNGYNYQNYAIPGHTTKNLLQRLQNDDVKEAVKGADIINISIGGNNFLLANINQLLFDGIVKNDYTRFDKIVDDFYLDLDTIVQEIRSLNPSTAILIQTIYNPQTAYVGEVYQQGADRLNQKITEYALNNPGQIIIVPVAEYLTDSAHDFAEDRIHPSKVGNEKIASAVLNTLLENDLGENTEAQISTQGKDAKGLAAFAFFTNAYGTFLHFISVIINLFK